MSKIRKEKISEKGKKRGRWVTLTALEICMVAIQLALCMQLGILCIQLSHLYSAPKLLENEWEKNSRKKKRKEGGGKGRKKIEERRGKKEMQVEGKRKGRKEKE